MYRKIVRAAVLGHAVGDAFGVPLEFLSREEVRRLALTEMEGSNGNPPMNTPWGKIIPKGAFSDDTSMMLGGMESLTRNRGFNADSIMFNFINWWDGGKFSSLNKAFGIGRTVMAALERYLSDIPALECGGKGEMDNGNGSLMRILPFSLFAVAREMPFSERVTFIGNASALTHGHEISKLSCLIYTEWLDGCLQGMQAREALKKARAEDYSRYFGAQALDALKRVLTGVEFTEDDVSGKGYVVSTLESVIYSVLNTDCYRSAILTASLLGEDVDTVCAITGAVAGILYGEESIPESWLSELRKKEMLVEIAGNFADFLEEEKNSEVYVDGAI